MSNNDPSSSTTGVILSGPAYKFLKPVATTILPGLSALYLALALIWDLPAAEQVAGTASALNVFLGLMLGLSTRAYNRSDEKYDGQIDIRERPNGDKVYQINTKEDDPSLIEKKDQVLFRVNKTTTRNVAR